MKATLCDRVQLGGFEVDLLAGELRGGERVVRLQEQPFQILSMLIARDGQVVTRDDIRSRLWPNDTVVEFDHSINSAIKRLRQALGDSADSPQYIETVARRGYRLLVAVEPSSQPKLDSRLNDGCPEGMSLLGADTPVNNFHVRSGSGGEQAREAPSVRQSSCESLIGRNVSHYRVLKALGSGGMARLYMAEDLKLGRHVALKFLSEDLAWEPIALRRFEREARTASSLDHPNICTIYEVEEYEEQPFIAMQLLHGETLRDRLAVIAARHATLALADLLDIAIQICDGLQAAHEKGIIHRDIKPANIFLTRSGQVKLLDFGLAKLVNSANEMGSDHWVFEPGCSSNGALTPLARLAADANISAQGTTIGTAAYMSPEQVRGEKLDARSDVFSFGVVLYEMATGHRAFTGNSSDLVKAAILDNAPTPVHEVNPMVPRSLEHLVNGALEKDREKRYQNIAEVRSGLERLRSLTEAERTLAPVMGRLWWRRLLLGSLLTILTTLCLAPFELQRPTPLHGAAAQILQPGVPEDLQISEPPVPYSPTAHSAGVGSLDNASRPKTASHQPSTVTSAGPKPVAPSLSYIELEDRLLVSEAAVRALQQREEELRRSNRAIVRQLNIAGEKVNREKDTTSQAELDRPPQENELHR